MIRHLRDSVSFGRPTPTALTVGEYNSWVKELNERSNFYVLRSASSYIHHKDDVDYYDAYFELLVAQLKKRNYTRALNLVLTRAAKVRLGIAFLEDVDGR